MEAQLEVDEGVRRGMSQVGVSRVPRTVWLAILVAGVALFARGVICPGIAFATYPGANGELAVDVFTAHGEDTAGPQTPGRYAGSDALVTGQRKLVACTAGISDEAIGVPCDFGAPSFSPDGAELVVSRLTPRTGGDAPALRGLGGHGQLMVMDALGGLAHMLPRLTSDDDHPAFLPGGRQLVFAGRSSPTSTANLYAASTSGMGLRRLTDDGGAQPAPCANGTIAYLHANNIWLMSANHRSRQQLTRAGGQQPSCGPDSRQIVFVRGDELDTIAADGRNLVALHATRGVHNSFDHHVVEVSQPQFSPNGKVISYLYESDQVQGTDLWLREINLKGQAVTPDVRLASNTSNDDGGATGGHSAGMGWQPRAQHP
jgi:Tol biopolymer transport system component